jgi:hypothetical protein
MYLREVENFVELCEKYHVPQHYLNISQKWNYPIQSETEAICVYTRFAGNSEAHKVWESFIQSFSLNGPRTEHGVFRVPKPQTLTSSLLIQGCHLMCSQPVPRSTSRVSITQFFLAVLSTQKWAKELFHPVHIYFTASSHLNESHGAAKEVCITSAQVERHKAEAPIRDRDREVLDHNQLALPEPLPCGSLPTFSSLHS